jgi:hypothetical protein
MEGPGMSNEDKVTAIRTILPALLKDKHALLKEGFTPFAACLWEGWKPDPDDGPMPSMVKGSTPWTADQIIGLPIEWIREREFYLYARPEDARRT